MSESERRGQRGDDNNVFGSPDPSASQQIEAQEVADSYFFLAENADALDASEDVEDVFGSPDPTASQQVEVQEVADSYFFLAENADALDASEMVEDSYYPFNSPDPSEGTLKTIQEIEEEVCDCRKGD